MRRRECAAPAPQMPPRWVDRFGDQLDVVTGHGRTPSPAQAWLAANRASVLDAARVADERGARVTAWLLRRLERRL